MLNQALIKEKVNILLANGFAPVVDENSRSIILGSMPGVVSLRSSAYYAHPRNAFWPIMQALFDWPELVSYEDKLQALLSKQLSLWDVIAQCQREGSLDSAIKAKSIQVNDFQRLFKQYPNIQNVFLNGGKATQLFNRYVSNKIADHIQIFHLPSTSPANARLSAAEKLAIWRTEFDKAGLLSGLQEG
ncbi:DNA-deoxyinosine glycosylase [Catenovulum sediminis]|uniref:DNA-deoxyinosine glycosylase n=1 Tax=Catenovulum sediminis TaxID=1740262 RepID=A0ABV1RND1_9ALTE|nr:DNA-deoxyinosine glycosylase [Catenovulum sediminis]